MGLLIGEHIVSSHFQVRLTIGQVTPLMLPQSNLVRHRQPRQPQQPFALLLAQSSPRQQIQVQDPKRPRIPMREILHSWPRLHFSLWARPPGCCGACMYLIISSRGMTNWFHLVQLVRNCITFIPVLFYAADLIPTFEWFGLLADRICAVSSGHHHICHFGDVVRFFPSVSTVEAPTLWLGLIIF
jgi:hypothetical protein